MAAALLAACTASCSASAKPPSPPRPASTGTIAWRSCPGHDGWQCGTLAVPLDHAAPAAAPGATITIALSRHLALASQRIGSLLMNPGGPGASGIQFAYDAIDLPGFAALADRFDLIGFDPRGVGQSTPIRCLSDAELDRINHLDPAPATPAELAASEAAAKELAAGCEAQSGTILPYVSTMQAAEDMDDIRAAVGDRTLTYLGFSYGSLLGAEYASLFPTHVRAVALDGAIDPEVDDATMSLDQAIGFEQNLNAFLATWKGGRAAFDALTARIAAAPLVVGSRSLGPGEALYGVADLLYAQTLWPELGSALTAAQHGDGSQLLGAFDDYMGRSASGVYDNSIVANTAINCLDRPGPGSIADFETLAAQATKQAPYFGAPVIWSALPCLYWPVPPVTHPGPLHAPGAPPIVVVGSTADPATPYPWAENLTRELGDAVLLTRTGEGHGGYIASACVQNAVDAYLISLTDPPPGTDCTT